MIPLRPVPRRTRLPKACFRGFPGTFRARVAAGLALLLLLPAAVLHGRAAETLSFNRDVRPILSDHCFACHGPDEKTRKAGLRLDLEAEARKVLKSGHAAIVPGRVEESGIIDRITTSDPDDLMPPAEMKKPLTAAKIDVLRRWVASGAVYEGHWAYVAPVDPGVPSVKDGWARNDLDRFIQDRLEREKLEPSPAAPKEKLLRRVTLDLTGLPPTVEEIDAFLADPDAGAYDKVVDRLLASRHYGERMAQHWLDLARYGETQGYHHDRHRDLWRWRDWVIRAFNENLPFDRFTTEQLAGDLLPHPTRDQLIATGFHRNEMTTSEGGALPEEYLVKYAVGRVDTTARVWLGTSMACAECHDHKYDPISQREFYQFFAFFYDTPENGLDAEELNPLPRITLETPEQRARAEQLDREVAALEAAEKLAVEAPQPAWDAAQQAWVEGHRSGTLKEGLPLEFVEARATAGRLTQAPDGSIATGSGPTTYELVLRSKEPRLTGLRLEALGAEHEKVGDFAVRTLVAEVRSVDPAQEKGLDAPQLGDWRVAGPFAAGSLKEAFEKEFGPERDARPEARYLEGSTGWGPAPVPAADGTLRWSGENRAWYLSRTLKVVEPRAVRLGLGSDDGVRVWLNGRQVHAHGSARSVAPDQDQIVLWLQPGENQLLVKIANGAGEAALHARVHEEPVTEARLTFAGAAADRHAGEHAVGRAIDGSADTQWQVPPTNAPAIAYFQSADPFGFRGGTEVRLRLELDGNRPPPRLRVTATRSAGLADFVSLPPNIRRLLTLSAGSESAAESAELRKYYRQRYVAEVRDAQPVLARKRQERDDERRSWPTAMVMAQANPMRETRIRVRGQYNQLGDRVEVGVPPALLPWRAEYPQNRLGLAQWLTDPRHPLTARVVVNQHWQRLFGVGLVKTVEEFGSQGDWPSHPELLDWLALRFVASGWDVKGLLRLIVTSATYRQDSIVRPELLERDPENRLLARGPRFRLDAENIRDVAMAASGLLNPQVGGPSVFPYQPPGLWAQVAFEGTADYVQSKGEDNYRRGLYTYWRRSIPYASFTVFDAPSREVCTVRRPRTNTPLQALALLNDPAYVEAARVLAQRILAHGGATAADRLRYAFRVVLGRAATEAEIARLEAACEREFKHFSAHLADASRLVNVGASRPPVDANVAELAAWTVVANTLLNLDETITRG